MLTEYGMRLQQATFELFTRAQVDRHGTDAEKLRSEISHRVRALGMDRLAAIQSLIDDYKAGRIK